MQQFYFECVCFWIIIKKTKIPSPRQSNGPLKKCGIYFWLFHNSRYFIIHDPSCPSFKSMKENGSSNFFLYEDICLVLLPDIYYIYIFTSSQITPPSPAPFSPFGMWEISKSLDNSQYLTHWIWVTCLSCHGKIWLRGVTGTCCHGNIWLTPMVTGTCSREKFAWRLRWRKWLAMSAQRS